MSLVRCLSPVLLIAVFAAWLAPDAALAVTFADGQVHTIDAANSFPFESVTVLNSPTGVPTTVQVLDGGDIGSAVLGALFPRENSIATMFGGTVWRIVGLGDSRVMVSGGSIVTSISSAQNAVVEVSGGIGGASSSLFIGGDGEMTFAGGWYGSATVFERGTLLMGGGVLGMDLAVTSQSNATIAGGTVEGDARIQSFAVVMMVGGRAWAI